MISASASLAIFVLITVVYFVMKYLFIDGYGSANGMMDNVFLLMYFASVLMSQLKVNYENSIDHCGSPQLGPVVLYTLLPNFFIFGLIIILVMLFPGWRAPFSNTIGYGVTYLLGIKGLFNKMLPSKSGNSLVQQVIEDNSMFINEMTPENFEAFIGRMRQNNLLAKGATEYIPKLYNLVSLKDSVSKFLWYVLTGCLVISTSYNAIVGMECNRTASQLKKYRNDMKKDNEKIEVKKEKVYAVYD